MAYHRKRFVCKCINDLYYKEKGGGQYKIASEHEYYNGILNDRNMYYTVYCTEFTYHCNDVDFNRYFRIVEAY